MVTDTAIYTLAAAIVFHAVLNFVRSMVWRLSSSPVPIGRRF